jgi:hypothetical protein
VNAIPAAHPRRSIFSIHVEGRANRGSMACVVVEGEYRDSPFGVGDLLISMIDPAAPGTPPTRS